MQREMYKIFGRDVPVGTLPCWVINENDHYLAIQQKRQFSESNYSRHFQITKHLEANILEGNLGYLNHGFHENTSEGHEYFARYNQRKPVYITFDRVTLYRILTIRPTLPLTFVLKLVDKPKATKPNTAFMIMPFRFKALNSFYQKHIKEFLQNELQLEVLRADDFTDNDVIIDTIYRQIENSEIIIADATHSNKNAFYELGYAAAKEKEIITIQDSRIKENLFFDRAHIRTIFYSKRNISQFRSELLNTIYAIRSRLSSKY